MVLLMSCSGMAGAQAATVHAGPATYADKIRALKAGDILLLDPGLYRADLVLHDLQGTARRPIVIKGADNYKSVFIAQSGHNTVSLSDAAYIEIHDLILDGRGLPVDAVKAEGPSHGRTTLRWIIWLSSAMGPINNL